MGRFGLTQLLVLIVAGTLVATLAVHFPTGRPHVAAWGLALFAGAATLRAAQIRTERATLWCVFANFALTYVGLAVALSDHEEGLGLLSATVAAGAVLHLLAGLEQRRARRPRPHAGE